MARTVDEIQTSIIASLEAIDPSIDVQKGPIFDFLLQPVPVELADTEARADRIARLVTAQLDEVATQEEVEAMATSFSVPLGTGKQSSGRAVFYTFARPTTDIPIPRGTLIGTTRQDFTFFVTDANLVLSAADADAYFNSARRRYEITANIEATSVGPDFDLPPFRINTLFTQIEGLDGVVNLERTQNGLDQEELALSVERIRTKFNGNDPEIGGGINSQIRNYAPDIVTDVNLVFPKDTEFRRSTSRPAIDAYVNGADAQSVDQSFVAIGGEQDIALEQPPVISVESVTVNGTEVDFAFLQDTSATIGGSNIAEDRVILESPVTTSDVVAITYTRDKLIDDLQTDLFNPDDRTFETDILAKRRKATPIVIQLTAKVLPSFDPNRTSDAIESALFDFVETGLFAEELLPEPIRQQIKDEVGGISELRFTKFQRLSGSTLDVEVITLAKNEVAQIDQASLVLDVRR